MLLAIDNGNTNVVFSVYDGEREIGSWRCKTDVQRTADEYAVWLIQLMGMNDLKPADIKLRPDGRLQALAHSLPRSIFRSCNARPAVVMYPG